MRIPFFTPIRFVIFCIVIILNGCTVSKAPEVKGRIAIVLDDWGYNKESLDEVLEIDRPLTISILPNLVYSEEIARAVKEDGTHDIILHLPLEAYNTRAEEIDTINTDMTEDEIISIVDADLGSVHGAVGISNHQGSRATEDKRTMEIVLGEAKKRGLFFLDSLTSPDSVCEDTARDLRVRFSKRDIFLDLTEEGHSAEIESYIKGQLEKLKDIALETGSAVGVGHSKRLTVKVIAEYIPEFDKEGIKIVHLEELMK